MEFMYYYVVLLFVHSAEANSTIDPYKDIEPYEDDFTPETFAFFNVSKKYKKFDLTELEALSRRWDLYWYTWWAAKQHYTEELNQRVCYFMSITYLGAMPELRRYFGLRFLYVNTLEYEIGYMTYDIVYRYQMMIEIYQIVYNKYYMQTWRYRIPMSYMFYMYRNILEYGMTIVHLCNMMHEIEKKYEGAPIGHWDDYPELEEEGKKKGQNGTRDNKNSIHDYQKRRQEEYKRRQRERRKDRKNINFETYKLTTPRRRPKKSFWPLHYGWSIEFW